MTTLPVGKQLLLDRIADLQKIPTLPAVLTPLLRYLQQPLEEIDLQKVIHYLSLDKSLTAQCLHIANSPLFAPAQRIDSLRSAVVNLGIHHVSDIALSCGVLNMLPQAGALDAIAFWEHSLGCAMVCRRLARELKVADPAKAYLAGLLHDLGIVVNLWLLPVEFRWAFEIAKAEGIPLHEAEQRGLGFTHCVSGSLLAQKWELAPDLIEVLSCHHALADATHDQELVALVHIADLLCRMSGLNYGYVEMRQFSLFDDPGFSILSQRSNSLKNFDWARLTFELHGYLEDVHHIVRAIYRA